MKRLKGLKMKKVIYKNKIFLARDGTCDNDIIHENSYHNKIMLNTNDIWLDAGANIGGFVLMVCDEVKKVICYEPDKSNFKLLEKVIKLNKVDNTLLFREALVSNLDKRRSFYLNTKHNMAIHSLIPLNGRKMVGVDCANINTVLDKYHINNIKMDVEGGEYELIRCIKDWSNIKQIILEYHFITLHDKDYKKYFELVNLLKKEFVSVKYTENPGKNWATLVYARR